MDAYIALGYKCNHQCKCCPLSTYDKLHSELKYDDIQQQISAIINESIAKNDKLHVVISGGEPFLNANIYDVLGILLRNNAYVTILTNASLLKNECVLNRLKSVLYDNNANYGNRLEIVTAIHSSDNDIHDWITGCKNSFWDTIEGLDNMTTLRIAVTIKIILSRKSVDDLIKTVQYIDEHFPLSVGLQFCGMDYCGNAKKNIQDLQISFSEIQPVLESALDYIENKNRERMRKGNVRERRVTILEVPLCMLDPYYWRYYILPPQDETLYLAPNIYNEKAGEQNKVSIAKRSCACKYYECRECDVSKICQGCWESAYHNIDNLLRPVKNITNGANYK